MIEVGVHEAKTQLSHLLNLVQDGEEVTIRRHGKVIARLIPERPERKSPLGAMKGEFALPKGWDRALSDEETDAFWQGNW